MSILTLIKQWRESAKKEYPSGTISGHEPSYSDVYEECANALEEEFASFLDAARSWKEYDDHIHDAQGTGHDCSKELYGACVESARLWGIQRPKLVAVLRE